jgi:HEAT repeat protein
MPTTGYIRRPPRRPPPLRIGSTGSGTGLRSRPKSAAQLRVSEPQRRSARKAAREALRGRGGAVRVARMAASGVGARSDVAARVLAAGTRITTLRRLMGHKDSSVRVGVARGLAYRPRFAPVLMTPLLRDRNLRVVRAAVQTASRLGDKRTVGSLATLALRYDRSIRALALRVLAQHARIKVAQRTVVRGLTHSRASVRLDAVVAVGLARAEWSRYWLVRLAVDRSSRIRRSVVRALARLAPRRATFRLLRKLQRDRSPVVRSEARRALKRLRRIQRAARRARRRSRRRP